jgi:hypothetical protein
MAETGKKAAGGATSPVNDPAPDIARRSDELPNTPEESQNAGYLVRTRWPHSSFVMEDVPVVTREGTKLTKAQLDKVEKSAELSGVSLIVEEVK